MCNSSQDGHEESNLGNQRDLSFILDSDIDAVTLYDATWRFVYVNAATERMTGLNRDEILGKTIDELWPGADSSPSFQPIRDAMVERKITISRIPSASRTGEWREARAVPVERFENLDVDGLLVYWRDITETKRLEDERRQAVDYALTAASALDAVQDAFMTVDQNYVITYANAEAGRINLKRATDLVGKRMWDEWPRLLGSSVEENLRAVMNEREPRAYVRRWQAEGRDDVWLEVNAYPDDVNGGIHMVYRDITSRHNQEERVQFLSMLADRASQMTDPDDVIEDAVTSLGIFLKAARCAYADIDFVADTSTIHKDYCAPGVSSIKGVLRLRDFGEYLVGEFSAGRPVAVADVRADDVRVPPGSVGAYEAINAIAHVTVPLVHSARLVSAIAVHSLTPRQWQAEEIELIQTVVERTWFTVELVRKNRALLAVQQRDHNIAEQLQKAIVPELPTQVNGLVLSSFYRAALQEAEVGGDFTDCFGSGENMTTLVVGDVSGKGLRAASQVAAIRNMLRFAIYAYDGISDAVSQLNNVLIEQNYIDGFATLFVGCFDAAARVLTYSNCGQEPGLVWRRASGEIEQLVPNGPIIGVPTLDPFTSGMVALEGGDVLALFTDGFTEAGPNRRELLGVEGVAELLREAISQCRTKGTNDSSTDADTILRHVLAGVEQHAGGIEALRDDIALLITVVL